MSEGSPSEVRIYIWLTGLSYNTVVVAKYTQ